MKKKIGFVEIGTLIIALLAFSLSIWQMIQTIKHNKLSVKPKISSWIETDDRNQLIKIYIENNGVGPAVIGLISAKFPKEIITVNGYKLGQFWKHTLQLLNISDSTKNKIEHEIVGEDFYLKPGDSVTLFKYKNSNSVDDNTEYLRIKKELQSMEIQIPYCSVYNDCEINIISPKEHYFIE